MLRFIIRRQMKDQWNGLTSDGMETVDLDVPELERILTDGGFSENGYDARSLVGVEVLPARGVEGCGAKSGCPYCLGSGKQQVLLNGVHVEQPCDCARGVALSDELIYERRQRDVRRPDGWGDWTRCTKREAAAVGEMSHWQFRVLRVQPSGVALLNGGEK